MAWRRPPLRVGAVAALALAAALATWILLDDDGPEPTATQPVADASGARIVPADALASLAAARGTPLFWAGPRPDARYELTDGGGRTYVRYLPAGAAAATRSSLLTVATYAQADGFEQVLAASQRPGAVELPLPDGGLAVLARSTPTSVFLSYPGADYQVEVYSPEPGEARRLVESGQVTRVGAGAAAPRALSAAALRAFARGLEGPLFWAGPREGATYELTQQEGSRTYVRYLPEGVEAGDPRAEFLSVGTYRVAAAFAAVRAAGRRPGGVTIDLPGPSIAVFDRARPTNVYVAVPGEDYQVEVFSPRRGEARRLVESGRVRPVG
jgi:hypothetical protein